jgi:LPXTG-site transpeptidase (sortase) family protein
MEVVMIRDRAVRVFSVLVVVAGLTAIVAGAGAEWTGTSSPAARSASSAPTTVAANRASALARHTPAPKAATKPAKHAHHHTNARITLPRSLPATMLPAGSHLPTPTAPPSDPYAPRQPAQLGRIVIPAIGLDQPFFEGVDQAAFAHGVGHWPGTAAPGAWGNAVFGGHRVTQTHPFLNTDRLHAGDEIDFVMLNGWTYVYRVTSVIVVPQTALWIADQKPGRLLTLFTCNPKGSATERLVTNGVLDRIVAAT